MLDRAVFADEQLLEQAVVEERALGRQCVAVLLTTAWLADRVVLAHPGQPADLEGA